MMNMRMKIKKYIFVLFFGVMAVPMCWALSIGDTKESVIKSMGQPIGSLAKGVVELLMCANGEINIRNGRVESTTLPHTPAVQQEEKSTALQPASATEQKSASSSSSL